MLLVSRLVQLGQDWASATFGKTVMVAGILFVMAFLHTYHIMQTLKVTVLWVLVKNLWIRGIQTGWEDKQVHDWKIRISCFFFIKV